MHFNLVTVYFGQISNKRRILRCGAYFCLSVNGAVLETRHLLEEMQYSAYALSVSYTKSLHFSCKIYSGYSKLYSVLVGTLNYAISRTYF